MASSYMPVYLVFLFSTILSFSNGSKDQEYKICSSLSSCGPVNDIRYPFWIEPNKPGYCGLYEFKLDCYNASDYPQMWKIQGLIGSYRVNSINTTNRTIVVNRDMNETCYALKQSQQDSENSKWQSFKLGPSVGNLTLSMSCRNNPTIKFLTGSLLCPGNNVSVSVYHFSDPAEVGSQCKRTVTFPVSKRALDEFIKNENGGWKLENVLEEAFEVEYNYDGFETCLKCQNSGGVCGSSVDSASNGLKCYHQAQRPDLGLILGLGITGAAVLIVIVPLAVFCYCKKIKFGYSKNNLKSLSHNHTNSDLENGSLFFGVPLFSYKDIQESTGNFDESRVLGKGGFGRVYYGKLNNGTEVAVKQLYEKSYGSTDRFINEVQVLTQLKHQNLVSLYGCTSPQCRELFLVYEYMRNGTVADHLFSEQPNSKFLTWPSRTKIAIETASALSYLHSSGIIHRDVKTKNILLDENFSVKVADFGLSRLFPIDVTHVSTAPQGSPGYLDPDYHQFYQLTDKSDVYSFGVVLIELISSLPAIDMNRQKSEINLSNFAMKRIQKCAFEELVDKRLGFGSDLRVRRMTTSVAELAFRCLQHDKEVRPSMEEVFEVLKRIESADYREELAVRDKELRTHHTQLVPPSPTKEDDRSRLLMSSMDLDQQRKRPPSPDSVMDEWVSRSGTSSSISAEKQQAS